jgi:hypothetical protein
MIDGPVQKTLPQPPHSNVDMTDRVDHAIAVLNELVALDREAVEQLVEYRVACGSGIADHPTAQVTGDSESGPHIGMLGVINGIFGVNARGWGYITAEFDDAKHLIRFVRTEKA